MGETVDMSERKLSKTYRNRNRKPKKGELVGIKGREGTFVVVDFYIAMRVVDLKAVVAKPEAEKIERCVPWPSIVYLDET
ncbi:MAG: hypothetical protein WCB05_11805 [Candidatus Sulfotelmatobacter sp.]